MTREINLFYAWQDDSDRRFNRFLIRIALEIAAQAINGDATLGVSLRIDSDTEGEPGWAPITATILNKIEFCDIFMPDLSFVCTTDAGKLVPNPNVMFESGYALRARTYKAIVPVMNAFYGPPEKLPFDMGHFRHPISYYIDPASKDAERRRVRARLAEQLQKTLRAQIVATKPAVEPPAPFPRIAEKDGPARFRARGEALGARWNSTPFSADVGRDIFLTDGSALWLRVFPEAETGKTWAAYELKGHTIRDGILRLSPFSDYNISYLRAEDGIAICSLRAPDEKETGSVAFLSENGEVWSVDTDFLTYDPNHIPFIEVEFSKKLKTYADLIRSLGVPPPYRWVGGIIGVKGRQLSIPPVEGQVFIVGFDKHICLSDTIMAEGAYDGVQTPASALYPLFKLVFDKCGIPRPNYLLR